MPKIFISYRREDSEYQADRLHAALKRHVANPRRDIFIDVDNIPVGVDFVEYLDAQVAQCDVLLAVIGPDWIDVRNPQTGKRRIDDPKDFVRIEIASALKRGIPVAPVLLDGTPFPPEESLPDDLKPLVRRNGVELRRASFDGDAERLIRGLTLRPARSAATIPRSSKPKPSPTTAVVPRKPTGSGSANVIVLAAFVLVLTGGAALWYWGPFFKEGTGHSAEAATSSPARAPTSELSASLPTGVAPSAAATVPAASTSPAARPEKKSPAETPASVVDLNSTGSTKSAPPPETAASTRTATTQAAQPDPIVASGSSASKPGDHIATMIARPDQAIIRSAIDAVKKTAECNAEYTIGRDGKAKDIKPNCTLSDYDRYVVQYVSSATFQPAVANGLVVEASGHSGLLQFQAASAAEKGPVLVTPMPNTREIANAIKGRSSGSSCELSYVVGTDGVPIDISAKCTPDKLNAVVVKAAAQMRFQPGQRDGQPVAWPVRNHQVSFSNQTTKTNDPKAGSYTTDPDAISGSVDPPG